MNQRALDYLALRPDFRAIARWVEPRATVLDLGCGDGSLLSLLTEELDVQGYGIEINDAGVLASTQNGVNVIQQNLEDGLRLFEDASFDFAILSQTNIVEGLTHGWPQGRRPLRTNGAIIFAKVGHNDKGQTKKTPDQQEKIGGVEWNSIYINEPTISCRC